MSMTEFILERLDEEERVARAAQHIARHDPARVLREISAKRSILAAHPLARDADGSFGCVTCHGDERHGHCTTRRLIALPYSDHPQYKESWRP